MTAQAHRPVAGTPIVSVSSRETIGYWTDKGPQLYPDQRFRFYPRQPMPITFRDFDPAKLEAPKTHDIWRTWGDPERGHQVWLTTATDPRDLEGIKGTRPIYNEDTAYAKDAAAIRRVLAMRQCPLGIHERDYMDHYASYLEDRARHQ